MTDNLDTVFEEMDRQEGNGAASVGEESGRFNHES
jgi:hypothetical protein